MNQAQKQAIQDSLGVLLPHLIDYVLDVAVTGEIEEKQKFPYLLELCRGVFHTCQEHDETKFQIGIAKIKAESERTEVLIAQIEVLHGLCSKDSTKDKAGIVRAGMDAASEDIGRYAGLIVRKAMLFCHTLESHFKEHGGNVPARKNIVDGFSSAFDEIVKAVDTSLNIPTDGIEGDKKLPPSISDDSSKILDSNVKKLAEAFLKTLPRERSGSNIVTLLARGAGATSPDSVEKARTRSRSQ